MNKSFIKIFGIATVFSWLLLVVLEYSINKSTATEHLIGWALVALFVGAFVGVSFSKNNH